ncbi:MAG: GNAT family N-acetyltransferase [Armatimonadota bacterium]
MVTIRLAGAEDIEQVAALRMAFLKEMNPSSPESETTLLSLTRQYITEKLPTGEFLVWFAEEDGKIVGTGGLIFSHRPPTANNTSILQAYILNMYTVPQHRGRGIATMLLQHIIEYVKTTPAQRIALQASEMGQHIYEKFGFKSSNRYMTLALQKPD